MAPFEVGTVLPIAQFGPDERDPSLDRASAAFSARRGDGVRHDPNATTDSDDVDDARSPGPLGRPPRGWRRGGVDVAGQGRNTWVLSALHRNPGIVAKAAETLNQVSRLEAQCISGSEPDTSGPGQAHAFGLPEDEVLAGFRGGAPGCNGLAAAHRTCRPSRASST